MGAAQSLTIPLSEVSVTSARILQKTKLHLSLEQYYKYKGNHGYERITLKSLPFFGMESG